MALDGDTALALQVHIVQNLILGPTGRDGFAKFKQTIRESTLPVINMGNDAEISNVLHFSRISNRLIIIYLSKKNSWKTKINALLLQFFPQIFSREGTLFSGRKCLNR